MKTKLLLILLILTSFGIKAQIPYFAPTVGDNKLYGYTSLKLRPGINAQETYTTFQYGIGKYFAAGLDIATCVGSTHGGALVRIGVPVSKWFNIGAQFTGSFNLNDNMGFSYLTNALYMNGAITSDGNLFWDSNTWYTVNRHSENTISQYAYLGYSASLPNGQTLTPMLGAIYSWKFDQDADMAFGAYWTIKNYNVYLWGNDFFKSHPRFIVGVDFVI